ncbi:[Fe-S]-binding protein [Niabella ginsenosidivorans]|uniref:[Fe-S]-binding protein n=1 Tax=Niabella ginsenosidivorans TaxID=1176587 RepID=A0A1A9IA93_9BACT|nr:TAT-variant-translocated molybdopterin oxidoreductase [Niabella ginsenosidivorans]ANH83474.1 [Fe-S]-binding protein [Niabella ginsenosidivorans]
MNNKYWQGFGEFNKSEQFQKRVQDEFRDELPFEDFDSKGLLDAKAPRRDFLKYLGFSTAAATLAASCKTKIREAIPYGSKPDNIIPGEAKYYATTFVQGGEAVPVVAKVRDGRPIKIEGNDYLSTTNGGTSARVQASVLDLYDMHRLRFPQRQVGGKFEESTFDFIDKAIAAELAAAGTVVLLTSSINSPTTLDIIAKNPKIRHVQYDAISYNGILLANEASGFGKKIPTYRFDQASVIVGLGADFLGTWLNSEENAAGYAVGRRINEANPVMSKHYQFESFLSVTGSNADERFTHRPSETGAVALALLAALGGAVAAPALKDAKLSAGIAKVAAELKAASGKALVVCGSNDINTQVIVNAINNAIGAYGTTIDWSRADNSRKGTDKEFADLLAQMEGGQVDALLIYDANPAYDYFDAARFANALKKIKTTVSFGYRMDETTQLCKYIIPSHHYLESWGDAEPKTGVYSFIQPTIFPLFKTRNFQTSLLKWFGNAQDYEAYTRNFWIQKTGSEVAYHKALENGILEEAASGSGAYNAGAVAAAATSIAGAPVGAKDELVLYETVAIGPGYGAVNPWLQELPDPISKACWGNYALISIPKAKELGIDTGVDYEYYPDKPVIKISNGKTTVELPILVIPGMNANTIAVQVGYGRSEKLGRTAAGVGKNMFPFASLFPSGSISYFVPNITVESAGKKEKIAQMQIHNSYEGRVEVLRETTLATYRKTPNEVLDFRKKLAETYAKTTGDFRTEATLYGDHEKPGIKWGMNIDMNACTGCSACVVACHAENNVPVVGKSEVLRFHDMHWLRIDRYFVSDEANPDNLKGVVFQPMLCQHCDNAPCENVCPVAATNHSTEGLNQMAYNRCIGTRYCANNCPFKVRRFNWADYTGADSFPNNQDQKLVGVLDPVVHQMNDAVSRMVLNPDVTVRSRGVMEKCSFCVQRLQHAKLDAKKAGRPLKDGEAKTACQQACSTNAIVFGDARDKESAISQVRLNNPQRLFYSLEQLHVLPNVSYFSKIRNTDEIVLAGEHEVRDPEDEKRGIVEEPVKEGAHH